MKMARQRKRSAALALLEAAQEDSAPELSLLNLVDLMLVFAVGLLLAIVNYSGLNDLMLQPDMVAVVQRPGSEQMELVSKKAGHIERMRMTPKSVNGQGVRIGIAYRLNSGEVVYVPEQVQNAGTVRDDTAAPGNR